MNPLVAELSPVPATIRIGAVLFASDGPLIQAAQTAERREVRIDAGPGVHSSTGPAAR
jgi:hypothetical protein